MGLCGATSGRKRSASAEGLLKKYPEADEIRSLLESTNQEFKAWRRAKELERALQALRGLIDGGRWAEARSASESGRQRFPEADAEFAALADQAAEAAAAAERRAKSATAAERAKRLASERRWAEAVLELDTAEAAYGKDSALESARLSIAAERKKHEDKVSAACAKALKLIDAAKWDEARKELSSKAFEGDAEVQRIRGLVEAGRLSEELGKKLSAVEASIAKENWEEVSRLLKAAEAEFPGEPKVASLAAAAQEAEAKRKLEKRIAAVVAEAERQSDPGVALAILTSELQQAGGDGHAGLRAAVSRFEKLKDKRDKALAGVVSKASQMVAKGNAVGAVSYLESVAGEWGQTPEWLAAANDAREAARIAQERELQQQRERELAAMRAEVTGLVAKGDISRARQYLEGVSPQWGTTQEWAAAWDEVREAAQAARERQLAAITEQTDALIAAKDADGAIRYLAGMQSEWGKTKEWIAADQQAREAARIARELELAAVVAQAKDLIAKGDSSGAVRYLDGVKPEWGKTAEWTAAAKEAREAVRAAEERALQTAVARAKDLLSEGDAAGAVRYLDGVKSEWGKTPEWAAAAKEAREAVRAAEERERREKLDREWAAIDRQVNSLLSKDDATGALQHLEGLSSEWQQTPAWNSLAKTVRDAVRVARERELAAVVSRARDLLAKGDAAGAVRYLDGVKSEWGKSPEWAAAAKEAREAVRAAEERERREKLDREWAAIDRQVNSLLSKDDATGALQHLEGLSSEWQQTPAWNSLAKTVRDAVRVARERELAAVVSRARDLLAKGDAAGAVRYLDGVKSEWGKSPEWAAVAKEAREVVRVAEERERKEKLDREWAAIDRQVNSLLSKDDATGALQHLEGLSSEWQQTPAWNSLAKTVRDAVRVARERELAAVVSRARDLLAKGDAAGAVRYLDGVKSEWGKSPEWAAVAKEAREVVRVAEERERKEKLDREWAAIDERVNSLLLKNDAAGALQYLEGLSSDWQQTPAWNSLAKTVRDAVRVARERELAAVLSKAKDLLAGGDSTASAQHLERVKPEWGQTPEWAGLYTEVQDAIQADRERIRNAEIATAVREIDALLDAGSSAKAKALAEQARDRFPQATAIEEARKRVDAALDFESRINQCLDSAQFDEAETAWIEGANFPSVVALGSEIERRRAAHQRASEDFAFHVRLLIRESRLGEAEQAIQRGTQFKGVVEAVRTELAAERAQAASRQRLGEYRQALERAWTQGDLATASATVQKAVQTDSEAQEVFDWMVEHERQKSEWEQRRKLEQLENRFRRALDANDFKTCEEALEKAKDFPAQEQKFTEWKTALDERKDKARQAEQALRIAGELRQQGNWQGALDALQGVPAGLAWTEAANKARRSIQEAKQAAERAAAAPSFDRTIVSAPAGASTPAGVESLSAIPVPDPPAAKKSSMMPLLAAGAVVIVGGGIWLSMGTGKAGAELSVNPTRLEFAGPGVQTVRIESAKPLEYQATGGAETWLSLSAKSGTAPGTLTVEAKPGKLGPGQHRSVIVVQGAEKSAKPAEIEVLLKIDAKTPVATPLVVTPRSLAVSYQVGQAQPAPRRVEIAGVPAAQCKVRITKGGDWLSASVAGAGVTVSFRLSGKVAGSYAGEIEVSSANSEAPVRVPVNLTIQAFRL
jgi:hypothetical protein